MKISSRNENKGILIFKKIKEIHGQPNCSKRDVNRSFSGRREMIPEGNLEFQERKKSK